MKEIEKEESEYLPLPKFYTFSSKEARERILYANFIQVDRDIKQLLAEVFNQAGAI